jgi:hypothetical protein
MGPFFSYNTFSSANPAGDSVAVAELIGFFSFSKFSVLAAFDL